MAFQSSGEGGQVSELNDINITPFVDVVLVLLVIFIITAPMLMKDVIELKLPETTSADAQTMTTLAIAVTEQGQILLNGQLVTLDDLSSRASESAKLDPKTQVIIAADINSRHGSVVSVIDRVKAAGLANFAIQVERQSTQ